MSIDVLRDTIAQNSASYLAIGGLLLGFLFGALLFRSNYCAMGSLSDIHNFGDYRRFRAWILAAATALVGTQLLQHAGIVALNNSMYLAPTLNWVGYIAGGLIFGFGMVFSGGCPSRNLARAGGGDLRSLMTLLVLGLVAYMTIGGLLGPARAALEHATGFAPAGATTQSLAGLLSVATGWSQTHANLFLTALLAIAALAYCFADPRFRASPVHVLSGLGVGAAVIAGWALTGLAFDEMMTHPAPPISLTYIRPTGDAIEWLTRFTAAPVPSFGVTSVFGAILGAGVTAAAMRRFQFTGFSDTADMLRNLLGAALMGVGGVLSLGCTIGQAVTGVSTLAAGSFVTFAAIVAGGFYGLRVLERSILAAV